MEFMNLIIKIYRKLNFILKFIINLKKNFKYYFKKNLQFLKIFKPLKNRLKYWKITCEKIIKFMVKFWFNLRILKNIN